MMDEQSQPLAEPKFSTKQPPPITDSIRRPYKGIFLTYFLFFCGTLFFVHGFHRYVEYTFWDLFAVWTLSILLMIPGCFFGLIIFSIQTRRRGYNYRAYPQLFQ